MPDMPKLPLTVTRYFDNLKSEYGAVIDQLDPILPQCRLLVNGTHAKCYHTSLAACSASPFMPDIICGRSRLPPVVFSDPLLIDAWHDAPTSTLSKRPFVAAIGGQQGAGSESTP